MTNSINTDVHNQRIPLYNTMGGQNAVPMQALPTAQNLKDGVSEAKEHAKSTVKNSFLGPVLDGMLNTEGLSFWQITGVGAAVTAACGGFVKLMNNFFRISEGNKAITIEHLENAKISKAAAKIDAFIEKVAPLRWIQSGFDKAGVFFTKVKQHSPKFIQEIADNLKRGSIAPWDRSQRMTAGKAAEAMGWFIDFLEKVPKEDIVKHPELNNVLIALKEKKINTREAFAQIEKFLSKGKNFQILQELKVPEGFMSRLAPGRAPDLALSFKKAMDLNMQGKGGLFGRFFKKAIAYLSDGLGGTFLGGKFGLIPHALFSASAVYAGMNAEKGDGLKKGMEDYIGNMIFGYLAMFPVSALFNKTLGMTEMGLDRNKIQEFAKNLGLPEKEGGHTLQNCVMRHNEQVAEFKKYKKLALQYDRPSVFGRAFNWFANIFRSNKVNYDEAVRTQIAQKMGSKFSIENYNNLPHEEIIKEVNKKFGINSEIIDRKLIKESTSKLNDTKRALDGMWSAIKTSKPLGGNELTWHSLKPGQSGFFSRLGRYVLQKPLRLATRILSVGRYTSLKASGLNFTRIIKRAGGGVGRIIAVLFLTTPFTDLGMKLSHKIFGKPKNSRLDEGKEEAQQPAAEPSFGQPKSLEELLRPVKNKNNPFDTNTPKQIHTASPMHNSDSWKDLYHQTKPQTPLVQPSAQTQNSGAAIQTSELKTNDKEDAKDVKDSYTYIPSSANLAGEISPNGEQPEFLPRFQNIFKKADIAEANAMKFLPQ